MQRPGVRVERAGAVLVITIDRPHVKNAMDLGVAYGIASAVDQLGASEELRVGVLTGAGGTFSAGMDLRAFAAGETPEIDGRGLAGIAVTPPGKPLIAAVEGWALGGGFELMLLCDMVIAAESARFGLPEIKHSLIAAGGGAVLLPRRVPPVIAAELLLTGTPIDARRAYELGLVNRVVPDGSALDEALALAGTIAEHGALAVAANRRLAHESRGWPLAEIWERQAPIVNAVLRSDEARAAVAAFVARDRSVAS
jgi:enoyl-CoA hydratase